MLRGKFDVKSCLSFINIFTYLSFSFSSSIKTPSFPLSSSSAVSITSFFLLSFCLSFSLSLCSIIHPVWLHPSCPLVTQAALVKWLQSLSSFTGEIYSHTQASRAQLDCNRISPPPLGPSHKAENKWLRCQGWTEKSMPVYTDMTVPAPKQFSCLLL